MPEVKSKHFEVFAVENHRAPSARKLSTEHLDQFERPDFQNKDEYKKWCARESTKHCFISMIEGEDSLGRLTRNNTAKVIHGLIADFDCLVNRAEIGDQLGKLSSSFWPSAISRSYSGGVHLVWAFEDPINFIDLKSWKLFTSKMAHLMDLPRLFPGFDQEAWSSWNAVYEVGSEWETFEFRLSGDLVINQMYEAVTKASKIQNDYTSLPWDVINQHVQDEFPKFKTRLAEGVRTRRFWDPHANAQSVIVTSSGCFCFTGKKRFVPWEDIIGGDVVLRYQADKLRNVIKDTYFIDGHYYRRNSMDKWMCLNATDLSHHLVYEAGLEANLRGKQSETMQALCLLRDTQQLDGIMCDHYNPAVIVNIGKKSYLNQSTCSIMEPHDEEVKWKDLGMLGDILKGMFQEQLDHNLTWLKHFYMSALRGRLENGLGLILVGPAECGKSFYSSVILSRLMGGFADGGTYISGEDRFNDTIFEHPVVAADDIIAQSGRSIKETLTHTVKQLVANQMITVRGMNRSPVTVPWRGRVIVSMNDDPDSITALPNVDSSILDKICLYQMYQPKVDPKLNWADVCIPLLPKLARYLVDFKPPKRYGSSSRFSVVPYHNKEILETAHATSPTGALMESLAEWRALYFKNRPDEPRWIGRSPSLIKEFKVYNYQIPGTTRSIGRSLVKLAESGDVEWLSCVKDSKNGNQYTILSPKHTPDPEPAVNPAEPEETQSELF